VSIAIKFAPKNLMNAAVTDVFDLKAVEFIGSQYLRLPDWLRTLTKKPTLRWAEQWGNGCLAEDKRQHRRIINHIERDVGSNLADPKQNPLTRSGLIIR
jgi:hypothetical protein